MPEPPTEKVPEEIERKLLIRGAVLSLLGFTAFSTLLLVAWFTTATQVWTWKSIVTLLSAAGGLTTTILVWRAPSRVHVLAGMIVMMLSLTRIGLGWTWQAFALLAITTLLLIPLVNAGLGLPPERK